MWCRSREIFHQASTAARRRLTRSHLRFTVKIINRGRRAGEQEGDNEDDDVDVG